MHYRPSDRALYRVLSTLASGGRIGGTYAATAAWAVEAGLADGGGGLTEAGLRELARLERWAPVLAHFRKLETAARAAAAAAAGRRPPPYYLRKLEAAGLIRGGRLTYLGLRLVKEFLGPCPPAGRTSRRTSSTRGTCTAPQGV